MIKTILGSVRVQHFGIAAAIAVALLVFAMLPGIGCTADQVEDVRQAADTAAYMTGAPTSRPADAGPVVDVARATSQAAAVANPQIGLIISTVGSVAALISGIIGHVTGKRSGDRKAKVSLAKLAQAREALYEVADDVAAFKDPKTPFSLATAELLISLGHIAAVSIDDGKGANVTDDTRA